MSLAAALARLMAYGEDHLPSLLLMVIVLINAVNVFLRYVVGKSAGSLFELMVMLSLVIYWIGIATAERTTGHLGMTFAVTRLSGPLRAVAAAARALIVLGFLGAVIVSGLKLTASQLQSGTVSGALELPIWCFSLFIPLGALLMAIRFVAPKTSAGGREPMA